MRIRRATGPGRLLSPVQGSRSAGLGSINHKYQRATGPAVNEIREMTGPSAFEQGWSLNPARRRMPLLQTGLRKWLDLSALKSEGPYLLRRELG